VCTRLKQVSISFQVECPCRNTHAVSVFVRPNLRALLPPCAANFCSPAYWQTVERQGRSFYAPSILNGDEANFFGAVVAPSSIPTQTLTLDALSPKATGAELEVALQGATDSPHSVSVEINGAAVGQANFNGPVKGRSGGFRQRLCRRRRAVPEPVRRTDAGH
jgi:hypothetical protein